MMMMMMVMMMMKMIMMQKGWQKGGQKGDRRGDRGDSLQRHTIHESSEALQAKKLGHYSLEMADVRAERTQSVEAYSGVFEGVGPFLAVDSCNCSSLADP